MVPRTQLFILAQNKQKYSGNDLEEHLYNVVVVGKAEAACAEK